MFNSERGLTYFKQENKIENIDKCIGINNKGQDKRIVDFKKGILRKKELS